MLRQSGGAYQFRHIRLQERLAARPRLFDRTSTPPTPADLAKARRRRRVVVALAAPVLVAATIAVGVTFNELRCASWAEMGTETDQVRTNDSGESYCVGIVREDRWDKLVLSGMHDAEDEWRKAVLLALANNNDGAPSNAPTLAVLGGLAPRDDQVRTTVLSQLYGIAVAQRHAARARRPLRIILVDTGPVRSDGALAAAARIVGSARAGAPPPAMLILDNVSFSVIRDRKSDRGLPLFNAAPGWEFEGNLVDSMLRWFAVQRFKLDLDQVATFPSGDSCDGDGPSVQRFVSPFEELPSAFDKSYLCADNHVSLIVSNRDLAKAAEKLVTATNGPDVDIYYPAHAPDAVITCDNLAGDPDGLLPEPGHGCTAEDPALLAHRAALGAAGLGEYTMYKVRCARSTPPKASVTCGEPVEA